MSQVTNVTVGYDRKRQPAQYESSGARVEFNATLSATIGDTEDHVAVATKLLGEAKTIVLTELGLVAPGTSAAAADVVAAAETTAKATKAKATKATKADAGAAAAASATATQAERQISSGNPDRVDPNQGASVVEVGGTTAAPQQAANTAVLDIPSGGEAPKPTQAPAGSPTGPTADELTKWVGELVKAGKLDSPTVKAISRKYGAEKIAFIEASKLGAYKAEVEEAVKRFGAAADL